MNITKGKIESVTKHLALHISRILNEMLQNNPTNAMILCDFIIAEQNERVVTDNISLDKEALEVLRAKIMAILIDEL